MIPIIKGTNGGGDVVHTVAGSTATYEVNLADGNVHDITLDTNCTLTLAGLMASGRRSSVTLVLRQDATGSRTVTWPAGTIWAGGTPPTLSTAADAVDVVALHTLDGGTVVLGEVVGLAFA